MLLVVTLLRPARTQNGSRAFQGGLNRRIAGSASRIASALRLAVERFILECANRFLPPFPLPPLDLDRFPSYSTHHIKASEGDTTYGQFPTRDNRKARETPDGAPAPDR